MHGEVIVLPYARPFERGDKRKDAWVQQVGKRLPAPTLLHGDLYNHLLPRLKTLVGQTMEAARRRVVADQLTSKSGVGAADGGQSERGRGCEVDGHGSGEEGMSLSTISLDPTENSSQEKAEEAFVEIHVQECLYQLYGFDVVADEDLRVPYLSACMPSLLPSGSHSSHALRARSLDVAHNNFC